MNLNFTQNQLIAYVYQELSKDFIAPILNTWESKDRLDEIKAVKNQLDKVLYSPSSVAIESILNYSKETASAEKDV